MISDLEVDWGFPAIEELRGLLDAGVIGEVIAVKAGFSISAERRDKQTPARCQRRFAPGAQSLASRVSNMRLCGMLPSEIICSWVSTTSRLLAARRRTV